MERDAVIYAVQKDYKNFNSHAHVERDEIVMIFVSRAKISTHTLTWSVTIIDSVLSFFWGNFNSHAHVERDCGAKCDI